jgi:hypothetical protein
VIAFAEPGAIGCIVTRTTRSPSTNGSASAHNAGISHRLPRGHLDLPVVAGRPHDSRRNGGAIRYGLLNEFVRDGGK